MKKLLQEARHLDTSDPIGYMRDQFHLPQDKSGAPCIYLCGNSLGLQPKTTESYVQQELKDWRDLGVEGHFEAKHPWMPYHEFLTQHMAEVVGAKNEEVVVMNSLTVNLHLMMVSFYRPSKERHKIMIEENAFPSDQYAVKSQIQYHGHDPKTSLLEIPPSRGKAYTEPGDILEYIDRHGSETALILIGGVNYYSGQAFPLKEIAAAGHKKGCIVGFDLAHGAGNIDCQLHDSGADFACWCTYKYLNSGPGGMSGVFVHERHAHNFELPRFTGWWGHDKTSRFLMPKEFQPEPGAEGWQLSNPPILAMAALRASLEQFHEVGIAALRKKSKTLTSFFETCIRAIPSDRIEIITPGLEDRGCQLSLRVQGGDKSIFQKLNEEGVISDWREPDVIRIAPVPMYNRFEEGVFFAQKLQKALGIDN